MKLVLHIGTEKTGTTSFQRWAYANGDALRRDGVWHSKALTLPDNRALAVIARDPDKAEDGFHLFGITDEASHAAFRAEIEAALAADVAEARAAGMRIYLVSNEHLQSRLFTQEMVDRVAAIMRPHFDEIEVICFLRPQLDTAVSLASTGSRVGLKIQRSQFETLQAGSAYYNFQALLDRWADAFGKENVTPVAFKRNKNTVAYFRERLALSGTDYQPEMRLNSALDFRAIAIGNQLNLPRFLEDGRHNPNRQFYMEEIPFEAPLTLSRDFGMAVHERFEPFNAEIAAAWPEITEEDLTPDWERYPEQGTLDLLEDCDLGPALRYVVQKFNADLYLARAQTDFAKARLADRNRDFEIALSLLDAARKKTEAAAIFEPSAARAAEVQGDITRFRGKVVERSKDGKGAGAANARTAKRKGWTLMSLVGRKAR
ncbi:MAG: hypothetical protein AAFY59_09035 [Pseudomonadota bacterium]